MFKKLSISTLNVKGLNKLDKVLLIKDFLEKYKVEICFLQETHIDSEDKILSIKESITDFKVFCDVSENKTKGVAILVKKSLNCIIENINYHNSRCMSLDLKIDGIIFKFINVYVPNLPNEQIEFIEELTLLIYKNKNIIIGGDFNFVEDNKLDRFNSNRNVRNEILRHQKTWIRFFKVLRFKESILNREKFENDFMTWSNGFQSSRIDRFYHKKDAEFSMTYEDNIYFPMSDHHFIHANIIYSLNKPNKKSPKKDNNWKLNESILNDEMVEEGIVRICQKISDFKVKFEDKWYEVFIYKVIKFLKRESRRLNNLKKDKINTLFDKMLFFKNKNDQENLRVVKKEIFEYYKEKRKGIEIRACETKRNFINQPSKVLIEKEKSNVTSNEILNYRTKENDETEDICKIINDVETFYKDLMGVERVDSSLLNDYDFKIKPISNEDRKSLSSMITYNEAENAIKNMNSAAPGPNGLTLGFYSKYFHLFGKDYVEILNNQEKPLTDSFNEIKIKLIPKNSNSTKSIDDLRPISLTNYEYRIFTKILTDRISNIAHNVIGEHQSCSIKGRRMGDNITLTRDLIHFCNLRNKKLNLISIDQRKAFDSISHNYLFKLLDHLNLSKFFNQNIKRLYENSFARIIVNQHQSNRFDIKSGIKQGCSLSMMLYVIAIEELLLKINENSEIKGVKIDITKKLEIKSSAYADDVVGYVTDDNSVDAYFQEFKEWGRFSGASINKKKTKIIRINSDYESKIYSVVDSVKILGIIFDSGGVSKNNYFGMADKLKDSLFLWNGTRLSLIERVVACKTFLLSKVWFIANFLNFTEKNIKRLNSMIFGFIWNNKSELIKRNTLIMSYNEGGLEMFNIKAKLQTIALRNLIYIGRNHDLIAFQLSIYFLKFHLREIKMKNFNIIPSSDDTERPIVYQNMINSLNKFKTFNHEKKFNLLNTKYSSKACYIKFRKEYEIVHDNLNINIDWKQVYNQVNNRTIDPKLREINYRIIFNALSLSFKFDCKMNNRCYFCKKTNEDQDHILINCNVTNILFNIIKKDFDDNEIKLTKLKVFYSNKMNVNDTQTMSVFKFTLWQLRNLLKYEAKEITETFLKLYKKNSLFIE